MIECGDIIKTKWGIMIVEKIKDNETFIGHELKGMIQFRSKNPEKDIEVLNSEFRYNNKNGK